jgi:predicted DNA-binding ribbon-helix-helix protein
MCQVFISADPDLYESRARSLRLHGVATSIKLENLFWRVLEEIAQRDGMSVPALCTKLYDELMRDVRRWTNCLVLRVCCRRYLPCSCRVAFRPTMDKSMANATRVLATGAARAPSQRVACRRRMPAFERHCHAGGGDGNLNLGTDRGTTHASTSSAPGPWWTQWTSQPVGIVTDRDLVLP